jgi:hypothetical protein
MKILLCICFLIFYSNILHSQPVEEVIVIEKIEDNISNPIESLYFLENRKNTLNINTQKRHFLHQSDDDLQINKAVPLGNTLAKKMNTLKKKQDFTAIATSNMQFMQDSHSAHLGFIDTPTFSIYTSALTTVKDHFYTAAKPSVKLSSKNLIFFPIAVDYHYNTNNKIDNRLGIGHQYKNEDFTVTTTAMAAVEFDIDNLNVYAGLEAVNWFQWKNFTNHATLFVTNKNLTIKDSFTFKKDFFHLYANSNFQLKYSIDTSPLFSMSHTISTGFNFDNISVFVRYYTDNEENDIEKSINDITPWKRSVSIKPADYAMEYLDIHWYSGAQVRYKHKKLLLEASSYVAANEAVSDINDSQWNPTKPFFTQLVTAGFYSDFMMLRFTPFLNVSDEILDYGFHSNLDFNTKHNIRIQTNNGVKFSKAVENIQIDNEIKLGYCLLQRWYLYHFAHFCNKYDFVYKKYSLEGKIGGGAIFQF